MNPDGLTPSLLTAARLHVPLTIGGLSRSILPHQKQGVCAALRCRRAIVAYDMGLGKTVIAALCARAFSAVFTSGAAPLPQAQAATTTTAKSTKLRDDVADGQHNPPSFRTFVIAPVSLLAGWHRTLVEEVVDSGDFELFTWGKVPVAPPTVGAATSTAEYRNLSFLPADMNGKVKKKSAAKKNASTKRKASSDKAAATKAAAKKAASGADRWSHSNNNNCTGSSDSDEQDVEVDEIEEATWASDDDEESRFPAEPPGPPCPFLLVCDEAHHLQSFESLRTAATLALCRSSLCVGVLLLTGTPMPNGKPCNILPLLACIGHELADDRRKFEERYCDARYCNFGQGKTWVTSGASNLDELHSRIGRHMLRLRKQDISIGGKKIAEKTRQFVNVPATKASQIEYEKEMGILAKLYATADKQKELLQAKADDDYNANGGGGGGGGDGGGSGGGGGNALLAALTRIRLVCSKNKIDAAVKIALDVLSREDSVVVFSAHVNVAYAIAAKIKDAGYESGVLTGETKADDRQKLVDAFQMKLVACFCGTFGAGGVGITLTAARTIILVDRPWVPGLVFQAEDRVHRIGQAFPVTAIWIQGFRFDEKLDELVLRKSQNASAVIEKDGGKGVQAVVKLEIREILAALNIHR